MIAKASPAGFWKRYVAYFIDVVLLTVVVNVLASVVLSFAGSADEDDLRHLIDDVAASGQLPDPMVLLAQVGPMLAWSIGVSTVLYIVAAGIYFVAMESSPKQASLGKQLLGLQVVDLDGRPLTRAHATGRFFAAGLSWITLNVGHAMAAWTRERRALHDFVAGTRVVNADPAHTAMSGWGWAIVALNAAVFVGVAMASMAAGLLFGQAWLGI